MAIKKKLTTRNGAPVVDNQNTMTAGPRGPVLLQDVWYLEKLAHFDREVIPERRMHAKGSGAYGTFTVTHDITRYTKARIFSEIGKKTDLFLRFSTVAGERGAADHWKFRDDDNDYYTQPGLLFRLMGPEKQALLFANTARAIGPAPREIQIRHIGNCLKADPAYGKGVADALGIPLGEVPK